MCETYRGHVDCYSCVEPDDDGGDGGGGWRGVGACRQLPPAPEDWAGWLGPASVVPCSSYGQMACGSIQSNKVTLMTKTDQSCLLPPLLLRFLLHVALLFLEPHLQLGLPVILKTKTYFSLHPHIILSPCHTTYNNIKIKKHYINQNNLVLLSFCII